MISIQLPLLETMALLAGCEYLSDLRYMDDCQRKDLARKLEMVKAGDASLFEWNDALEYLTGAETSCASAEQAKTKLITALSWPRSRR